MWNQYECRLFVCYFFFILRNSATSLCIKCSLSLSLCLCGVFHSMAIGHWCHSAIAYLITHSSHTAPKCMFVMVSKDNFNEIVTLINGQTHFITIFSKYIFVCVCVKLKIGLHSCFRRCLCRSLFSLISWLSWLAIQVFWFILFICFFFLLFYFLDKFCVLFYSSF